MWKNFGVEPIQKQLAVIAEHSGDLLERLDPPSHDLTAPIVEELTGPDWRVVRPQDVKLFTKQDCSGRSKVCTKDVGVEGAA